MLVAGRRRRAAVGGRGVLPELRPYLGLILAIIPPAILAFAESGPLAAAAVIVVGGVVLNLVAENVLEPTLTGRALSLSTWLVFIMFFFWVWLLGPVGALLSMPITVLLVLVLQHNEPTHWVAALLTRRAPATDAASPRTARPAHVDDPPDAATVPVTDPRRSADPRRPAGHGPAGVPRGRVLVRPAR